MHISYSSFSDSPQQGLPLAPLGERGYDTLSARGREGLQDRACEAATASEVCRVPKTERQLSSSKVEDGEVSLKGDDLGELGGRASEACPPTQLHPTPLGPTLPDCDVRELLILCVQPALELCLPDRLYASFPVQSALQLQERRVFLVCP